MKSLMASLDSGPQAHGAGTMSVLPISLNLPTVPSPPGDGTHETTDAQGVRHVFDHRDGKRHGPYTYWRATGDIWVSCHYVEGQLDGNATITWEDGGVTVAQYVSGTVVSQTSWSDVSRQTLVEQGMWTPDGKPAGVHRAWDDGILCRQVEYKEGRLHGMDRTWGSFQRDADFTNEDEYCDGILIRAQHTIYYGNSSTRRELRADDRVENVTRTTRWYPQSQARGVDGGIHVAYAQDHKTGGFTVLACNDEKGRDCRIPEGEVTVWKACQTGRDTDPGYAYVRLTVPADAQRVTPLDKDLRFKVRVSHAKVEQIVDRAGQEYKEAYSCVHRAGGLVYRVGQMVKADTFDADPAVTCGAGINAHVHRDHCSQWMT